MFGNNKDGLCFPLHGYYNSWMAYGDAIDVSKKSYGGINFKNGTYRRDNGPYENVLTARTH